MSLLGNQLPLFQCFFEVMKYILSGETQEHLRKGKSTSLLTLSVDRFLEYSYKHSVRKDDKDIN